MQSKLDNFFKKTSASSRKKYFVYDSEQRTAYYTSDILGDDYVYLTSKCKGPSSIDLYYKKKSLVSISVSREPFDSFLKNEILKECHHYLDKVPLLKSNLQKAIRRSQKDIAIKTMFYLLAIDKSAFFRRLPIIMIEDVALFDSMNILVWFMISSDTSYLLTLDDVSILINIVSNLCDCLLSLSCLGSAEALQASSAGPHDYDLMREIKEADYKDIEKNYPHLLGLYYRRLYGGMSGDMKLIDSAIEYYSVHPEEIQKTNYLDYDVNSILKKDVSELIILESIDFHCYPEILTRLNKEFPFITKDTIREMIWFAESAPNIRKSKSLEKSRIYTELKIWKQIKKELDEIRKSIMI